MNRRHFIKKSSLVLPALLLPAIKPLQKLDAMATDRENKIAIIGAGVSGLYMAKLLLAKGYDVTVFEAQNRIGGRVKGGTFREEKIDLGGQWLHHVKGLANSLTAILKQSGQQYTLDDNETNTTLFYGEKIINDIPRNLIQFFTYLENTDFPTDQPLSVTINAFSKDPELKNLIDSTLADLAASSEDVSTKEFIRQMKSSDTVDYLLNNRTMYDFISSYFSDIPKERIKLSSPINRIEYKQDSVKLSTQGGSTHLCNKVIISVPISQLQNNSLTFSPSLPERKVAAFHKIGIRKGLKMFIFFDRSILSNGTFNNRYAPYYLQQKVGPYYAIVSLLMGNFATAYYNDTMTYRTNVIKELSKITKINLSSHIVGSVFQDWGNEPFIEGAYSFPLPDEGNARIVAVEPVKDTLFFIGEAMHPQNGYGFIHGAMDTALSLNKKF
ncbi:MAG: FAD-dependent oxidoreductase [Sphingobacterium sp.]|jgi:monoamine oxidase|nr:FAD-dependent oxidoreductase [Sphingobacterium sp.]